MSRLWPSGSLPAKDPSMLSRATSSHHPPPQSRPQAIHFLSLPKLALLLLCLMSVTLVHADTISGTIQDPSGAVVANAQIQITGGNLTHPSFPPPDGKGKFLRPTSSLDPILSA